ncbi:MAG: HupE/UreJ family protein, partial [Thermodesulfobacteriota bacterium]
MKYSLLKIFLTFVALIFIPNLVYAHTGNRSGGFTSGFFHPVLGLDHFLAMVSVGILSAQIGGRAIWTVPATFVSVMVVGGITGMKGVPIISVELGIAFSVFTLGITIAAAHNIPIYIAMFIVGIFAIFH